MRQASLEHSPAAIKLKYGLMFIKPRIISGAQEFKMNCGLAPKLDS
jgi:hypothetical protein